MSDEPAALARISLDAVRHNTQLLRRRAGRADVMAVVKADGYGHGAVPVARAALAAGATWLGTATIDEALRLRGAGIGAPVLSWLNGPGSAWQTAIAHDVDLSAGDTALLAEIGRAAIRAGTTARVHLKVDTGLGRGGCPLAQWPALVDAALKGEADGTLRVAGLWSHLGSADDPHDPRCLAQLDLFRAAAEFAGRAGVRGAVRHLANSAATLTLPEACFDLVRPGIALYGLWPEEPLTAADLRPAMSLRARLTQVKRVPAGQGVSYGHAYRTARDSRLALVPLGYADGVPRAAGNTAPVWVSGTWHRIAGRVCMDQFVLDLGDTPAAPGDEVVLFGAGLDGEPTLAEWVRRLGTIANEIVVGIGARVTRVYTGQP
ncbi:alanine racemase [Streptomyces toyocaensis]|uniref:Alanine racemase n=1 Tax=Streptomyces toyocaensis TaxID=55952 RepID=A0A081XHA2_STRTO|nr:alanine racemase [Streptomyces toyocaensis]KES02925.1 alanine racemase [Streptomyces toyocaensis]